MSNETFCYTVYIFVQQIINHNMINAKRANVRMPKAVLHIPGKSRFSLGLCAHKFNQQSLSRATIIHFPECSLIFTFTHGFLKLLNSLLATISFLQQNTPVWFYRE